ncbi:voltage-gated chloride channel protein [Paenibacillus sambharensis]|uniref:Voltage-gated chloride channel protein n=1 Tax=Paenibacillus sambharensis TaxID=1803190 RepID=A0A2W1LJZ7_9BACL|nr:voltage-gated chloride channel family protein [Paenibacillus sambharensis]PZD95332.1 voltage-gated chloride channel protein [Paenibacillus sambharensis]
MNTDASRTGATSYLLLMAKWLFWGSLIGAAAGCTTAFLITMNDIVTDTRKASAWLHYLLPLGGAVIGFLYRYFGSGSRAGNDLILEYIHEGAKKVPLRMGPIVFVGTFITHLLGGSTGREGAAIQMAGSLAEAVNRIFRVNKEDRRILLIAAISGGFGSAFGTPITGVVFGMEVVALGRMRYDAVVPCFIASLLGHLVTTLWGIKHEHHVIKQLPEMTALTFGKVFLLAALFSLASVLYSQIRHGVYHYCSKHLPNLIIRGFLGGLVIVGLTLLIGSRDYLGRGLPMIDQAFEGTVPPLAFFSKIIFTAITMGTGFRGGEVIPLFFIGSTLGNVLAPLFALPVSFAAALGLVGVFCGAAQAPLACFVLSLELFGGKGMFYFFIVCIVSHLLSGYHSIYPTQQVYEPKSRMFNLKPGETISSVEKGRRK